MRPLLDSHQATEVGHTQQRSLDVFAPGDHQESASRHILGSSGDACLVNANFAGSDLDGCDLSGADLSGANLESTNLSNVIGLSV